MCLSMMPRSCRNSKTLGKLMAIFFCQTMPYLLALICVALPMVSAVILGKTNLDEFSMGSFNNNSHFGACINPWSEPPPASSSSSSSSSLSTPPANALTPGGSSGGSASAVASFTCYAALGSDTGGSIRLPAAYCGIVGFKPSYGALSRFGLISYASSLDTPSIATRTVEDAKMVFSILFGADAKDSTSRELPASASQPSSSSSSAGKRLPLSGVRVGIPLEYNVKELPAEMRALWARCADTMAELGATLVTVSLPNTRLALPAYYILASAEAASNLARYDGIRYGHSAAQSPYINRAITGNTESSSSSPSSQKQQIDEKTEKPLLASLSLEQLMVENRSRVSCCSSLLCNSSLPKSVCSKFTCFCACIA